MRQQQKIWYDEHRSGGALPSMANVDPSSGVTDFAKYLTMRGVLPPKHIVDIGCGKGRNAVYMARLGFTVTALDYIDSALEAAKTLAQTRAVDSRVELKKLDIDRLWPFSNDYFDLAIDSFSSIDIETLSGREICRDELFRTLKPGGLALITLVSTDDEWEKQLIQDSPGPEPGSTYWPQTGKFQKNYNEPEIRQFYHQFEVLRLNKKSKPAFKLDRHYTATNYWVVLQKPASSDGAF